MKNTFVTALSALLLMTAGLSAQSYQISGRMIDTESRSPLPGGHVYLQQGLDSLIRATITMGSGAFILENVPAGTYTVKLSYVGYEAFTKTVTVNNEDINLGTVSLNSSKTRIEGVSIFKQVPIAEQSGDTTQFNAEAFTTMPDATTEDLLRKMPGMSVENGKVEAMGEEVEQVLVDGKPFFRNDPTAALRTLPAEVVDKIEVFDKETDEAEFTGISTGETVKALNIITRAGMGNGFFGKAYLGGGAADPTLTSTSDMDPKYIAGGNINWFNGDRRITLVAQTNNINQQNFMTEDLLGVMAAGMSGGSRGGFSGRRGGGMRGSGGGGARGGGSVRGGGPRGGSLSDFLVGQQNGISTTHSVGLNFTDSWGGEIDLTGSYFFNWSDNDALERLTRTYILGESEGQLYRELNQSDSRNINHRVNLRLTYNINDRNQIFIRPRLTLQENNGLSAFFGETEKDASLLNRIDNQNQSDYRASSFSNTLLYRHRFEKERRNLSLNLMTDYNDKSGHRSLYSLTEYFTDPVFTEILDQRGMLNALGWSLRGEINYAEPLGQHGTMQVSYSAAYREDDSETQNFNYLEADLGYTDLDTLTSNVFYNNYVTQRTGASYMFNKGKIMFNGRIQYQIAQLNNEQLFPTAYDMGKTYRNLLFNAMFRFRPSREQNLVVVYRNGTRPPSISQLQEVIDNSNPVQLRTGNADLEQSNMHTSFLRYSKINTETSRIFFFMLMANLTDNYIGNHSFLAPADTLLPSGYLLKEGTELISPVNLDNSWNIRSFATFGFPVYPIKSNLNFNLGFTYTNRPNMANGVMNYTHNSVVSGGLVLSSNVSEFVDFTVSSRSNYNIVRNSFSTNQNNNYLDQRTRFNFKGVLPRSGLFAESTLTNRFYDGLAADYDQNYWLWNAAVGKKLFDNQLGELKIGVYDLLNQNKSIQRQVSDIYVEDVQNNILQRYFMLTFTYNIRSFGGGDPEDMVDPGYREMRRIRDAMD